MPGSTSGSSRAGPETARGLPRRAGGGGGGRFAARAAVVAPPRRRPRPPAADRAAVGGVLLAELLRQRRLLVEIDEARDSDPEDRGVGKQARAAEERRLAEDAR